MRKTSARQNAKLSLLRLLVGNSAAKRANVPAAREDESGCKVRLLRFGQHRLDHGCFDPARRQVSRDRTARAASPNEAFGSRRGETCVIDRAARHQLCGYLPRGNSRLGNLAVRLLFRGAHSARAALDMPL